MWNYVYDFIQLFFYSPKCTSLVQENAATLFCCEAPNWVSVDHKTSPKCHQHGSWLDDTNFFFNFLVKKSLRSTDRFHLVLCCLLSGSVFLFFFKRQYVNVSEEISSLVFCIVTKHTKPWRPNCIYRGVYYNVNFMQNRKHTKSHIHTKPIRLATCYQEQISMRSILLHLN